jgi:aminopeptidase-like protein
MRVLNKLIRLIIIGFIAFATVKITTFGWNFFTPGTNAEPQIVELRDRLRAHVCKLSEEIGDRNLSSYNKLVETAQYITRQLEHYAYKVHFQRYWIDGKEIKNIIAERKGSTTPQEIIVVGAHYDTCFNPGADDNASGVAGLLELARFLKDKTAERTIELVFFVNEEPPFFKSEYMGSRVFAREAKRKNKNIKAVIVFDMIGYYTNEINSQRYPPIAGLFFPNKGNYIGVFGNLKSSHLVSNVANSFKRHSAFPVQSIAFDFIPGIDFSDHWSFWQEGYQAAMVSDTAFLRHNNYHRSTDTWEKLNYEAMACVVEGFSSVVHELVNPR